MSKKRKPKPGKPQKQEEDQSVKLKPILGIQPGVYLTAIYSVIILFILFLILILPGIVRNGTYYSVSSDPPDATVYLDGIFAGTSPGRVFVPKGQHKLKIEKAFHEISSIPVNARGRVFGSLLVPRKDELHVTLVLQDLRGFLEWNHREFSSWSLIDGFHPSYQPEPLLAPAVHALYAPGNTVDRNDVESFILSAATCVTDEALLKDLLKGYVLHHSSGNALSPAALINSAREILLMFDKHPTLPFWLVQALGSDAADELMRTDWFIFHMSRHVEHHTGSPSLIQRGGTELTVNTITFIPLQGGSYTASNEMRGEAASDLGAEDVLSLLFDENLLVRTVEVTSFAIAETEVTKAQFELFLREVPEWRKENVASLMDSGLVTETYLQNWDSLEPDDPVTFVSWHAADAFCRWLDDAAGSSYTVRLPLETEWEYAAAAPEEGATYVFKSASVTGPSDVLDSGRNEVGVYGLLGNVWEWCREGFRNASFTNLDQEDSDTAGFPCAEHSVRGGSWANDEIGISRATRGSQPPSWCTEFLGFRPVLVSRQQ